MSSVASRARLWGLGATLAALVLAPPGSGHSPGVALQGSGTASIDGVLGASEWSAAGRQDFGVTLPSGGSAQATLFVMNDGANLYVALRVSPRPFLDQSRFGVWFDDDHDAASTVEREDGVSMGAAGLGGHLDEFRCATGFCADVEFGGRNDGASAAANDGTASVYEVAKPLSSGDVAHDFELSAGRRVGFTAVLDLRSGGSARSSCVPVCNILDPANFGDIVIAAPPPVTPPPAAVDSDGDGIPDGSDACPRTPAGRFDSNRNGCPGPYPTVGRLDLRSSADVFGDSVRFLRLSIRDLPPGGATVLVRHRSRTERIAARSRTASSRLLVGRVLRVGETLIVQATKPGWIGYWGRFRLSSSSPLLRQIERRCIRTGGGAPVSCASVDRGR